MRFLRFITFTLLLLLVSFPMFSNDLISVKSEEAVLSDTIFNTLYENGMNPTRQLLDSSLSENFPYNIVISHNSNTETDQQKKLVIVFPQSEKLYYDNIFQLVSNIKENNITYPIDILFTANDLESVQNFSRNSEIMYNPSGSLTYIQSLFETKNIASIIIMPENRGTISSDSFKFSLFPERVELTPGGISITGESYISPLSFFSTIINSFAKQDIPYTIKGYFLTLYQLGLIADDYIIGAWLENEIPSVSITLNESNTKNVFFMLDSLLEEYPSIDFSNQDTNYSFLQLFSQTFFITEKMLLTLVVLVSATVLFGFFNFSFIKGRHKHVHKKELIKTWYIIPAMILSTGFFLFIAQKLVIGIIPYESGFVVLSFILKIVFAVLFLMLFSFLQYVVRVPLTGFIYAYTLSLSSAFNIIIFSIVEITLAPLFIGQYIVVQISQRMRRIVPIMLCLIFMTLPYFPLVFNIVHVNSILNVESIMNADIGMNMLLAFFMLPFQLMVIRILTRLKLWGMRLKTNKQKIVKESLFVVCLITLIFTITVIASQIYESADSEESTKNVEISETLHVSNSKKYQFENTLQTIEIVSDYTVVRYVIELKTQNALPIFDANYPYDILSKPFTAIFNLDDYPPNPLKVDFTTQNDNSIICAITAWVNTDTGIKKIYKELVIQEKT